MVSSMVRVRLPALVRGKFGTYEEWFHFITVELEEGLVQRCFYCRGGRIQCGSEVGFGAEVDLSVIIIAVGGMAEYF